MNEKPDTDSIAKRYQTKEPARVEIYGKKDILFCRMNNLSATGAFLEVINTNYTPKVGDLIRITINLKQLNTSHIMNAEVVWSNGAGMGVTFLKQEDIFKKLSK